MIHFVKFIKINEIVRNSSKIDTVVEVGSKISDYTKSKDCHSVVITCFTIYSEL